VDENHFTRGQIRSNPILLSKSIHSVRIGKQDRFFGTPWNGFTNLPNRLGYREWGIPVPWTFPPVVGPVPVPAPVSAPVPAAAASTAVTTATTVTATASASVAAPSVQAAGAVDHGSSSASAAGPGPVSVASAAAAAPLFLFAPRTWLDDDSEDSDSCDEIAPKASVAGKRKRQAKDNQNSPATKKHEAA
jgi:hypothetical protein